MRPARAVDDDVFLALEHSSGVRSHLSATMLAAQPGPRLRALGSRAAYVKWGLDVQEDPLRSGARPARSRLRRGARVAWGLLGTEEHASRCRQSGDATSSSTSRWSGRSGRAAVSRHRCHLTAGIATLQVIEAARPAPPSASSFPCNALVARRAPTGAPRGRTVAGHAGRARAGERSSGSGSCCSWRWPWRRWSDFAPRADAESLGPGLVHAIGCAARGGCETVPGDAPPRSMVSVPPLVPIAPRGRRAAPAARGRALGAAALPRARAPARACARPRAGRGAGVLTARHGSRASATSAFVTASCIRRVRFPAHADPVLRGLADGERLHQPGRPRPRLGPLRGPR